MVYFLIRKKMAKYLKLNLFVGAFERFLKMKFFVGIIFPAEKKAGGRRQAGAGAHGLVVHLWSEAPKERNETRWLSNAPGLV